ncbi:dipeptidase [Sediminibacillus massiliensis]|uniref:dipeptidase n=1 Tax=Sediminibacillus massiliensis TaxID=1926277 RepID=UPI0009886E6C|nr:dipeptidase [Sediminibacillus massiliensis]
MIIDAHCDVLLKIWERNISFFDSEELQVNYVNWKKSPVKVQCFAIFVPEEVPEERQFHSALEMVNIFYKKIIDPYPDIKMIRSKEDILSLKEQEKGAILTLEGCHSIGRDISKMETFIQLGVKAVGLTWNQSNAVADGILEKRGAGVSSFGEEIIDLLNKAKVWTDLSHISYKGFFDAVELADYPMASHSNAKKLASHPRNLDDRQIHKLIEKNGWIGVTFEPDFIKDGPNPSYKDVFYHIDYFLQMGAEKCLGFGSDFDGTTGPTLRLNNQLDYDYLLDGLPHFCSREQIEYITHRNFIEKFPD